MEQCPYRKADGQGIEAGLSGEIWVSLDLEGRAQAGAGPESTEEYGVTLFTSCVPLGGALSFQSRIDWGKQVLFTVASSRPYKWRVRVFDTYVSSGWLSRSQSQTEAV